MVVGLLDGLLWSSTEVDILHFLPKAFLNYLNLDYGFYSWYKQRIKQFNSSFFLVWSTSISDQPSKLMIFINLYILNAKSNLASSLVCLFLHYYWRKYLWQLWKSWWKFTIHCKHVLISQWLKKIFYKHINIFKVISHCVHN